MMLQGKTALITGAGRGIGRAIALAFAREGANVAVIYAGSKQAAEEVCQQAAAYGVQARAYQCDVADFDRVKETVQNVQKDLGGVDILVNNAGVSDRCFSENGNSAAYPRSFSHGLTEFSAFSSSSFRIAYLMPPCLKRNFRSDIAIIRNIHASVSVTHKVLAYPTVFAYVQLRAGMYRSHDFCAVAYIISGSAKESSFYFKSAGSRKNPVYPRKKNTSFKRFKFHTLNQSSFNISALLHGPDP